MVGRSANCVVCISERAGRREDANYTVRATAQHVHEPKNRCGGYVLNQSAEQSRRSALSRTGLQGLGPIEVSYCWGRYPAGYLQLGIITKPHNLESMPCYQQETGFGVRR